MTVTRYSATKVPGIRRASSGFSDAMVERYLQDYYVADPFYAPAGGAGIGWRILLRSLADEEE